MQALTIKEIRKLVNDNTKGWESFKNLNIKEFRTHAMHIMVLASSMTIEKNESLISKGLVCTSCHNKKESNLSDWCCNCLESN